MWTSGTQNVFGHRRESAGGLPRQVSFLNRASHNALDTFRNYPHIGNRPVTAQTIRNVARAGEVFFSD